ncbi:MAG: hypothetical protein ACKV22_12310 [Bryobacteraceae bacterium]
MNFPPKDMASEPHYSIAELSKLWRLSRETVRLLVKDEPGVIKVKMGRQKSKCRYSVPESVMRRIHNRLLYPAT